MNTQRKPSVLIVYFTYTQQSRKVAEAMAEVFRERGCAVELAQVGFTDKRWAERFTHFPLRHAWRDVLGMAPVQIRRATGEIQIPGPAQDGDYDLVCIGSPTWFFYPSVPIQSYLKSEAAGRVLNGKRFTGFVVCRRYWNWNLKAVKKLGTEQGGKYVDGTHFTFEGGQIRSFMALLSYFGKGENRERYLGLKIPPSMLKQDYQEQARAFAEKLAEGLETATPQREAMST